MAQSQAQGEQSDSLHGTHSGSRNINNGDPLVPALEQTNSIMGLNPLHGNDLHLDHLHNGSNSGGGIDEPSKNDSRAPLYDCSTRLRAVAGADFRLAQPVGLAAGASSGTVGLAAGHGKIDGAGKVNSASTSTEDFASTSKPAEVPVLSTLFGIAENPVWRPKKFIRNAKYPGVSATGFYFQDHSGGFVLIHRASSKYDSFYTKAAIKELEVKYGKAKRSPRRSTRRSSPDSGLGAD